MKKLFIAGAIVLAGLASASCAKNCSCQAKLNGEILTEKVVEKADGKKCSDYNETINVAGVKAELKCSNKF